MKSDSDMMVAVRSERLELAHETVISLILPVVTDPGGGGKLRVERKQYAHDTIVWKHS